MQIAGQPFAELSMVGMQEGTNPERSSTLFGCTTARLVICSPRYKVYWLFPGFVKKLDPENEKNQENNNHPTTRHA